MPDVGGADGSDDEQVELAQGQKVAKPDMEIGGETEDSQSSPGTSSRLTCQHCLCVEVSLVYWLPCG